MEIDLLTLSGQLEGHGAVVRAVAGQGIVEIAHRCVSAAILSGIAVRVGVYPYCTELVVLVDVNGFRHGSCIENKCDLGHAFNRTVCQVLCA